MASKRRRRSRPATTGARFGAWDCSVLPIDPGELAEMDESERKRHLSDYLNQAADLLEALADAFRTDLARERALVTLAAKTASHLARRMHDEAEAAER